MKVKVECEKVGLKLNIHKTKIMASGPITSWEIDGETVADFILGGSKITVDGDCSHEIKRHLLLGRKVMTNLYSIVTQLYMCILFHIPFHYGLSQDIEYEFPVLFSRTLCFIHLCSFSSSNLKLPIHPSPTPLTWTTNSLFSTSWFYFCFIDGFIVSYFRFHI